MIFQYNNIEARTAKAVKLNVSVVWGAGKAHEKSIWFPMSVIDIDEEHGTAMVADWFYSKLNRDNAFHGLFMYFAIEIGRNYEN